MEGSRRCCGRSKEEMLNCALESQGRLLEEGTPELVLKEEQGLVNPEGGSLADEMGSDAGWPVTQRGWRQSQWEEMKDWSRAKISPQVLRSGLKTGQLRSPHRPYWVGPLLAQHRALQT